MRMPCTKSGKCGNLVWQNARYGMICYKAFVPFNPRTPPQQAARARFAAVSQRWRTLAEAQHLAWIARASTIMSRPRLSQCGPLTGCQLFVKVNVARVHRGQPQVDLPPAYLGQPQPPVLYPDRTRRFGQLPVAATLFLQTHHRLLAWPPHAPRPTHHVPPAPT